MEHPPAGLEIEHGARAFRAGPTQFGWANDNQPDCPPSARDSPVFFRRAIDFVDANIDLPISVSDMADRAGFSRYHFIRLFKKTAGMTPRQFIIHRRLEKAREMLVSTESELAEVSYASGFSSQSHLCYMFKREFGVSPGVYRRLRRERAG